MRFNPAPLIALLLCSLVSSSQDAQFRLSLRSGSFIPEKNINDSSLNHLFGKAASAQASPSFVIIQFEKIPSESDKAQLKRDGINLIDYIPNNAYTAYVNANLNSSSLSRAKARSIIELSPAQKMDPSLISDISISKIRKGVKDIWISYVPQVSFSAVANELQKHGIYISTTDYKQYNVLGVNVSFDKIEELASLPFISYVQPAPGPNKLLLDYSTANSRANVLRSNLPGGRNLRGEGVVVGVGDLANPFQHIDFSGRVINRSPLSGFGPDQSHGIIVMGIVGGAGIYSERWTGFAPKSTMLLQAESNIIAYASNYVQDYNMVITNNSYGDPGSGCESFGTYNLYSKILDQQAFQHPSLQHVFAAGNSGATACASYANGFHTVFGGFQSAKNVITVGNTSRSGIISPNSSKGPVKDGRIKPDISAQGDAVASSYPIYLNPYTYEYGTSLSSPAVAGGLALLYQRYRQLQGNADPSNSLMKAIILNGATDMGQPGPDYKYGYGWMNLLRSVKAIEQGNYVSGAVPSGDSVTSSITIPAGLAQLKVMLYWNDSAASVFSGKTLVNDLDLEVSDPMSIIHLPLVLDSSANKLDSAAVPGVDHLNNSEQVIITNPPAGQYNFTVKGTTIPFAAQHAFSLVYDTIPVSTTLTFPIGGEHLPASVETIIINWDSYGNPSNDFTVDCSFDNGTTWNSLGTVAANLRQLIWVLPGITTDQARIRVTHNGTGEQSTSEVFTLLNVPTVSLAATQCEGYVNLNWTAVTGATDYEVMILRGQDMVAVGTTTSTNFSISGLSKDTLYWATVRARLNGHIGRRADPVSRQPNNGTCAGLISNNDLKLDAIVAPVSGRKSTSTELTTTNLVTIRIKNLDDVATTGDIPVSFILGANPVVNETIIAPNIAPGATFNYTFTATVDMAAISTYPFKTFIAYAGDSVPGNDTIASVFKQLDNPYVDLTTNFLDNLETAPIFEHTSNQVGLEGLDRYDFVQSTSFGRIRSYINSGMAYSGSKALTLDADRFNSGGTADSLKGTFNLLGYNPATEDIRLDFRFRQHGQLANPANNVWIRGDDLKPWIPAYDLFTNQEEPGIYKRSTSLELSDLLISNSQTFSSSFQVRWGQWGQILAADDLSAAGYTFDDIRFYKAVNDIQMLSIDTPVVSSCGLGGNVPVRVSVRNSANVTISGIDVIFQIDNLAPVTETISSIGPNGTISYTFTATANLSAPGTHVVKTWVNYLSDSFRDNDTTTSTIRNSPLISTFPYLENFETGDGFWYASGKRSSWTYGTPASTRINKAASGTRAWKTNLTGNYNDDEKSYLFSPCFNLTGMTTPTLSLSLALDLEDCGADLCDAAYVEYTTDGTTWSRLGTSGAGTNWYNKNYAGNQLWSVQSFTRWHVATIPLPSGASILRLRFAMSSDPAVNFEGIGIDDIHIYDNVNGIYEGPPYTSAVANQAIVSGNNWIDFTTGGKLLASVNPNGQNLGSTDAQAFINTAAVRTNANQYYHDRNITIKPTTTTLADSATVRFYFLESETVSLVNATGCGTCSKPASAYELGVSKYSDVVDANENGTIADDATGNWLFIVPSNTVKVPFDKGYYAEFKVKDFSEFWLNNGGINSNVALPVKLTNFTAVKKQNDVFIEWKVEQEDNISYYDIEVSRGSEAYRQNQFVNIGRVMSKGNTPSERIYQFTDAELNKTGSRYYRLKIVGSDGQISYSSIRSVIFDGDVKWQLYPNPSSGIFNLVYQVNTGEVVTLNMHDLNGKLVYTGKVIGNGFVQKLPVDIQDARFTAGMYLLEATVGEKKRVFRVMKK